MKLEEEDSEDDAIERARSNLVSGTSSIAFRESRGAGDFDFAFCNVQVAANFNTCPGEHELRIYRGERPHRSGGAWTNLDPETRNVTIADSVYTFEEEIEIKAKDTDYTVFKVELVRRGCDGKVGDGSSGFGSFHADLFLGRDALGHSAGSLLIDSADLSGAVYTPAGIVPALAGTAEAIRSSSGLLLQVRAPLALADIAVTSDSSYEVRFYHHEQVGTQDPATKLYAFTGLPFVTHRIENPDGTTPVTTRRLRYSQLRGTSTKVQDYSFNPTTAVWALTEGAGSRTETRTVTTAGATTTTDIKVTDAESNLVAHKVLTEVAYAWGKETTREVVYTDATHSLATDSVFYTSTADGGAYGRLKQRTSPTGFWEKFSYDEQGRLTKTVSQYLDAPATVEENASRVVTLAYDTLADIDGDTLPEQRRTTIETVLGTEVRRSYRVEWSKPELPVAPATAKIVSLSEIRCTVPGAAWDDAANLVTKIRRFADGDFAGRTVSELSPDGTLTTTAYAPLSDSLTTTTCTGAADPAGTSVLAGTRTVTTTNFAGQQRTRDTFDIASGLLLSSETTTETDEFGRPTRIDYADGTFITRGYACCGLESETDREGNQTTYHYDALGRVESTTRGGITTLTPHDPEGRVLTVTRRGSDASEIVQQTNLYDLAGRRTSTSDALNRTTTVVESTDASGHRVVTTTLPGSDSATRIETYAFDGSLLSVAGTAAAPVNYEYGVDADGTFVKEIKVGSEGETTEWTKSSTDFAGRPFKTVTPSSTSTSFFNSLGQLVRSVDPDGVQSLYDYDSLGRPSVTALDLDRDGVIDFDGTDRITRTTRSFLTAHATTVERTVTETWATDNTATPSTVATTDRAVDGLRSWTTANGLTTSTTVAFDAATQTRTEITLAPDGTSSVRTLIAGRLASEARLAVDATVLEIVFYEYDAHGRLKSTARPTADSVLSPSASGLLVTHYSLLATTSYTSFDDDQIHTVTTPDPDPTRTGSGYDPQTITYAYDTAGRLSTTTLADTTTVTQEYFPNGQLKKTYGSRTYPQEYTYDTQGRLKTLKTWQNYANDTGAAVTTWAYDPVRGWLTSKVYPATSTSTSTSSSTSYFYFPSGRLHTRTWARTVAGQPLVATYTFNNAGDLATIDYSDTTPDVGFVYDRLGRRTTTTDAAGTLVTTYEGLTAATDDETYAAASPLLPGLAITRTRDTLLRPASLFASSTSTSNLNSSVSYSYQPNTGRLDTLTAGELTHTYGYQPQSSLIATLTQKKSGATVLTTTRTYDRLNRLSSISSAASTSTSNLNSSSSYQYNAANQRTRLTREDGAYWSYGYDAFGQVTSAIKHLPDATPALAPAFAFTFDDIGNRLTATSTSTSNLNSPSVPSVVSTYTPNLLNQYEQRTVPPVVDVLGSAHPDATVTVNFQPTTRQGALWAAELTVDNSAAPVYTSARVIGVRSSQGPNGEDAVAEETRHAFVARTPERFEYDLDGNLTSDGRWTYVWDAENRLIEMASVVGQGADLAPRQKLEFTYDSAGRRIRKQVFTWNLSLGTWTLAADTRFLYDGWNLLAEFTLPLGTSNLSLLRSYAWGLDLSGSSQGAGGVGGLLSVSTFALSNLPTFPPPASTFLPAFDGNGNVLALVDAASGTRVADYEYGPFGEVVKSAGPAAAANPFGFSTKYTDSETGLLYYGFRYYNASTGRWLSRDPIEERGGVNLYGMVGNDSVDYVDFLGLEIRPPNENEKRIIENNIKGLTSFQGSSLEHLGIALGLHTYMVDTDLAGGRDADGKATLGKVWAYPELHPKDGYVIYLNPEIFIPDYNNTLPDGNDELTISTFALDIMYHEYLHLLDGLVLWDCMSKREEIDYTHNRMKQDLKELKTRILREWRVRAMERSAAARAANPSNRRN